jgi:hypothetical protein
MTGAWAGSGSHVASGICGPSASAGTTASSTLVFASGVTGIDMGVVWTLWSN